MPIALLYHDVVESGMEHTSGFQGPVADRYKLTPEAFAAHLEALASAVGAAPALLPENGRLDVPEGVFLTFDDGGVTAHSWIAEDLEERGWRGHFFITADRIGTPGFVDADQIRDLRSRGHLIGTHSFSHPPRMSACSPDALLEEWRRSREVLSDILAAPVTTGSVPGGFYSHAVAAAAAKAGLRYLFTSEPTRRTHQVSGCMVLGRYTLYRGASPRTTAALASGRPAACIAQMATWNAKKLAKAVLGTRFLTLSRQVFSLRNGARNNGARGIAAEQGGVPTAGAAQHQGEDR